MYKHNFNFLIFLFALAQCRHNSSCDRTARASLTETVTPPGNKVVLPAQNTSQIMANVSQMTLVCSSSTLPQQDHSTSTINRVTAHSSQLSTLKFLFESKLWTAQSSQFSLNSKYKYHSLPSQTATRVDITALQCGNNIYNLLHIS